MDAGFEAHLRADGETFGGRDAALLRAVDDHGSLNAAAEALGRSYSRAHGRIAALEERTGPLVERERGGAGGGGSRLTGGARELLARFDRLQAALAGTAGTERMVLDGQVLERDGDLVTVATPAGQVRALAPGADRDRDLSAHGDGDRDVSAGAAADRVQVSFRSDAVTLHGPADAPADDATSARNRFEGVVESVEPGAGTVLVGVDVGATDPLVVRITDASRRRLGIEPGARVVARFKATATRAVPAPDA